MKSILNGAVNTAREKNYSTHRVSIGIDCLLFRELRCRWSNVVLEIVVGVKITARRADVVADGLTVGAR